MLHALRDAQDFLGGPRALLFDVLAETKALFGATRGGRIYVRNTGDKTVAYHYAHEWAHNNARVRNAGLSVLSMFGGQDSSTFQRYLDKFGENPRTKKERAALQTEFLCDVFGAYVYEKTTGWSIYYRLGLTEQEGDAFCNAFNAVLSDTALEDADDAGGITQQGKQFSSHDVGEDAERITKEVVSGVQKIGARTNVRDFTSEERQVAEPLARRYWSEVGVKSPFFRAWFGDWRAHDTTPVQIADVQDARRGPRHNMDTEWSINVSGKVFNESRHAGRKNQAALPYLSCIGDIVEKAILLDSCSITTEDAKSANSLFMHSFYAVADIGYGPELLKLYVEEMFDPNSPNTTKRSYQLQNIEVSSVKVQGSENGLSPIIHTADVETVSDLLAAVKWHDKSFQPEPVDPALLNEDGTPRILYHNTYAQFTEFDPSRSGTNQGATLGDGIYLSMSPTAYSGKEYGTRQMQLYAAIRKPFEVSDGFTEVMARRIVEKYGSIKHDIHKYDDSYLNHAVKKLQNPLRAMDYIREYADDAGIKTSELLKELGFDGIHDGIQWVAFDPTQVKSATDNIGTFDGENGDIFYSSHAIDGGGQEDAKLTGWKSAAMELYRRGVTPEQYYKDASAAGNFDSATANELAGIMRRNGKAVGGRLDDVEMIAVHSEALVEIDKAGFFALKDISRVLDTKKRRPAGRRRLHAWLAMPVNTAPRCCRSSRCRAERGGMARRHAAHP